MSDQLDLATISVLVIDDSDHTRGLIRNMLGQLGVKSIGEAANGEDGVMEILRTRPSVVLCDVHMKPMDGLQVVKKVRAARIPEIATTPIIMLTADNNAHTVTAAKNAEVDGYLVKPPFPANLKSCLERAVAGRRSAAAPAPEATETKQAAPPPANKAEATLQLACPMCGTTVWAPPGSRLACLNLDRHSNAQPVAMVHR